ncbi:hypothetical protein F4677DRAFT_401878 [Hypoxylon crocopeplum]|nr:hypothetical protein F4677DRAFT_401878 [Hypoxylon crocopeplum]
MLDDAEDRGTYLPLPKGEEDLLDQRPTHCSSQKRSSRRNFCKLAVGAGFCLAAAAGFATGTAFMRGNAISESSDRLPRTAPYIPLPRVERTLMYSSPFSREPPQGEGAGQESEPIWDALIPNGLGYFRDDKLAPKVSIPTVIHQLHCLYVLRRAYYSQSDHLEAFDFGKDRASHAAHCFDYLEQSLTCSVDSTVEPAEENSDGFLGSGFPRQCRDYDALKEFVEQRKVFNASGFLAHGLNHGHVHIVNS